ncbi:uncharacterized protein LOC126879860 [Diabrotica virgifera virgifera]|uniref:Endonuclease-reverse transcriptase n=1 Tax=Diabrotica virgifera virgifera TaxID=50390 RepID=A0ABM5JMG5_DIAVI|nr:uncharacterized protein LOC126879860 [Diabrotica virgifera virgifera]
MSRTMNAAEETYVELKQSAEAVGLAINTNKTKLLIQTRSNRPADDIEHVNRFTYLGMDLVASSEEEPEINRRLVLANKAYFAMGHIFKSRDVHRKTKLRVYKTIIRPIVSYGCETWVVTQKSANALDVFERKVLRRILGPIRENNNWRIRYNREIYEQYSEPTLAQHTKLQRLRWAGHVVRMHENRIPRKLLNARMQGRRQVGRPKNRWEDEVDEDARNFLGTRSWKRTAVNRNDWRSLLKEAKARFGL